MVERFLNMPMNDSNFIHFILRIFLVYVIEGSFESMFKVLPFHSQKKVLFYLVKFSEISLDQSKIKPNRRRSLTPFGLWHTNILFNKFLMNYIFSSIVIPYWGNKSYFSNLSIKESPKIFFDNFFPWKSLLQR